MGLTLSLGIAVFLSPFASKDPDGLDRVSQDLKFEEKAVEESPSKQLPFSQIFDEYSLHGGEWSSFYRITGNGVGSDGCF